MLLALENNKLWYVPETKLTPTNKTTLKIDVFNNRTFNFLRAIIEQSHLLISEKNTKVKALIIIKIAATS